MKISQQVTQVINHLPLGRPFSIASLRPLLHEVAAEKTIRQAVFRLAQSGKIKRAARGVFVRPEVSEVLQKEVLPTLETITAFIAEQSGEHIEISGAEAALRLELTTQAPLKPIFLTSGYSRTIKMGRHDVLLKHVSPRKLIQPGTPIGMVVAALYYLGKKHVSQETIRKIKTKLSREDFAALLNHLHHMPEWMAKAFLEYK